VPGYAAPEDTAQRARAAMGPFVKVFAQGEATEAVWPVVAEMEGWVRKDPAAADWLHAYTGMAADDARAGTALAGTVLAWSHLHGTAGLEASGQCAGMGHQARMTLLNAQLDMLADAFGLR
jgi:hypothetical protein